jgi:hypothetical protein
VRGPGRNAAAVYAVLGRNQGKVRRCVKPRRNEKQALAAGRPRWQAWGDDPVATAPGTALMVDARKSQTNSLRYKMRKVGDL